LAKNITVLKTIKIIEDTVEPILSDLTVKKNPEFLTYVANIVENAVGSSFNQSDKISLIFKFLKKHFEISDSEEHDITLLIQFAYDNGQVKKLPVSKKIGYLLSDVFKSKLTK